MRALHLLKQHSMGTDEVVAERPAVAAAFKRKLCRAPPPPPHPRLGEELLLQLEDGGPAGGALDAAQRHGAVPLLALRVHVQQGASRHGGPLGAQHHRQGLGALVARVVAQGVALVAAPQQGPGLGLGPQGQGPGSGARRLGGGGALLFVRCGRRAVLVVVLLRLLLLIGGGGSLLGRRAIGWRNEREQSPSQNHLLNGKPQP